MNKQSKNQNMNCNVKKWEYLWVVHLQKTNCNFQIESHHYDPHVKTQNELRITENR